MTARSELAKRLFDVGAAVLGLILLAPLFLAAAIWIRLDSPGPVFFRQERVGRWGRPFRIHKFRTMSVAAPRQGPPLTIGVDARITRAGTALRKYKIDEIPQLIDVVRGKMSLVGPRPEVPRYVAFYPDEVRRAILSVRPGITDFAAIEFRNEADLLVASPDPERTYLETVLPRKLVLYQRYVNEQSLLLDLELILRTLGRLGR